ncbi:MAG TPA: hypothetical protein VGY53_00260 [Isosphaeraceae bacterium]|nr:hypothetical protein [Isosphaeraceae bacterium]
MADSHIDAHALAAELSPKFDELLTEHRDELIQKAGGKMRRWLVAQIIPLLRNYETVALEMAIALFAWKFENMTIGEIVNALFSIRASSPVVWAALKERSPKEKPKSGRR